jgi:hypothetical protein
MTKIQIKEAFILFAIQVVLYTIFCINFTAVAKGSYHVAALTDFMIGSLNFFVIRRIATSTDTLHQWFGYAMGCVGGSYLGIYLSTVILK